MKPFYTIANPHRDILEGRLKMDIFAADLWNAYKKTGSKEYSDPKVFFEKTYLTEGLDTLLKVVKSRLEGKGGDPTIRIETPFGGGKTHSLIAFMHKAVELGAKVVVLSGTELSTNETLWGVMEEQLNGKIKIMDGFVSPGKAKIKEIISPHQPLLILLDELLEYATKAAGKKVEKSTLAAQTMAFIHELTETVSTFDTTCLVFTLAKSRYEHYDEQAEELFLKLQKITGREDISYTPVQDEEIAKVIRKRLFSFIDLKEAEKIIKEFVDTAQKEGFLPIGIEPSEYRERFLDSYPFMPEVIDVLYHRWGSFHSFQRTRGVLRLLALVIESLKDKKIPYISLADFDLANPEIRQELIKHIGQEFNSVIAQDITSADSGSKKVDLSLGESYKKLNLGTRVSTAVFMYSFSAGQEKGATLNEIKRAATTINIPSSTISEVLEQMKNKLFYFQIINDKYLFKNEPNLNRIIITKMENVSDLEVMEMEKNLLKKDIEGKNFKVFIWEHDHANIPDTEDLKLVILREKKQDVMDSIIKNKGSNSRVNCNTIFFLYPNENERRYFEDQIKRFKAINSVKNDKTISLRDEQKKQIENEQRKIEQSLKEHLRRLYRFVGIPQRDGFKEDDLGIPTYGSEKPLDSEVYKKLVDNGDILEKITPIVLKNKYLIQKDYVEVEQLANSFYKALGEPRIVNKEIVKEAISEGVKKGLFGFGELKLDKPQVIYFKEEPEIYINEDKIIIRDEFCKKTKENKEIFYGDGYVEETELKLEPKKLQEIPKRQSVLLKFNVPKGKVNDIMRIVNYLQEKFNKINIRIEAKDGEISEKDYENKIEEAFKQLGIPLEEDNE